MKFSQKLNGKGVLDISLTHHKCRDVNNAVDMYYDGSYDKRLEHVPTNVKSPTGGAYDEAKATATFNNYKNEDTPPIMDEDGI